jgi:hypothetical protein
VRALGLALAFVLAACGTSAESRGKPSGSTGPTAAVKPVVQPAEALRAQACECTTAECAERVTVAIHHERERVAALVAEADQCLVQRGVEPGIGMLLAKMREFTDQMCACADRPCTEKVQRAMMEWGLKNMAQIEKAMKKATPAHTAEGEKLDDEMDACRTRAQGTSP